MYLANATNVPVRLVTGFVIQPGSHLCTDRLKVRLYCHCRQ